VEKYLNGREFTVGILSSSSEEIIPMPVEIIVIANDFGNKILSFKTKKEDRELLISIKDKKEHKRISEFAKKAFIALGGRDYGRIDLRMDEHENLYFLEANLAPGLNPTKSYFIKTCKRNKQMSYEEAILKIVKTGLIRSLAKSKTSS
ncbi:MAG: D-alanine--D-alanine ligase, partial [Candidatus Gracilibacteria bacterium]